jgi:hypothetical protein
MCCSTFIEEMEPCPIEEQPSVGLVARSKENRRREDTLEAFHDAVVSFSIFEELEEVKHLARSAETDAPAPLAKSEGGHPNRNEAVLAKGKAEVGMPADLQEELAVLSCVDQLIVGRSAEWESTEDERPCVEGQVLGSFLPLLSDELNSFELLEAELCNSDGRQRSLDGNEGRVRTRVERRAGLGSRGWRNVRKP